MQDVEPVTADHNKNQYEKENNAERCPPGPIARGAAGREQAGPAGEPSVDAMIARLDGLDGLPLAEHVAVFEDTHAALRQVLSELDAAPDGAADRRPPGPAGPGGPGGR
ncbi:MAG TPA: hypothetical protein VGI74_03740 [Streptosporangiaceae bacterium]